MSPAAAGSAVADDAPEKQLKDKMKESAKAKSSSVPGQRSSSLLQTITSFGSSSSRLAKSSSQKSSPQSQTPSLPSSPGSDSSSAATSTSNAMHPPPVPLTATTSSTSSPGPTPTMKSSALPSSSATQSKSDPALTHVPSSHPHVSITPPQRGSSPAAPMSAGTVNPNTLPNILPNPHPHHRTRPRGQSTSTIRLDNSPSGTVSRLTATPMTRVISNPLPQPTSRSPSPSTGVGRGRAISLNNQNASAPSSREPSLSRGRSPLRDLAMSWSQFAHPSSSAQASPVDSRPSTSRSGPGAPLPYTDEEDEKEKERRYWWHLPRAGTPRPWTEDANHNNTPPQAGEASEPRGVSAAHHPSSFWHRRGTVPPEHHESWTRTKERVEDVVKEMADLGLDVVHDTLEVAVDVLEFAPVVGLAEAARVLLTIWDAVQLVEFNRLACLRLTERCANMLLAVKGEIQEADRLTMQASSSTPKLGSSHKELDKGLPESPGKHSSPSLVSVRLKGPLDRLISAFRLVLEFLERLSRRPFLKRYLKRDEIQRELGACDNALNDAFSMFELSVQIRIYEQVLRAEQQRQADTNMLFDRILHTPPFQQQGTPLPPYQSPQTYHSNFVTSPTSEPGQPGGFIAEPDGSDSVSMPGTQSAEPNLLGLNIAPPPHAPFLSQPSMPLPPPPLPVTPPTEEPQVRERLQQLNAWQNEHDKLLDFEDLRQMMRRTLERNDDAEMIQLLQVKSEEAPEALKALQRALEDEIARERMLVAQEHEEGELDNSMMSMQAIVEGVMGKGKKMSGDSVEVLGTNLSRKQTVDDAHSSSSSSSHPRTIKTDSSHDTLDREFMESGIDSLLRLSAASGTPPVELSLPAWTITRYEVDLEESVGQGFFSQVWKGNYRNRFVAVKVLASWTPKEMFLQEVHVWNELRHKNILEMVGASAVESTHGDAGWGSSLTQLPWFIVSRYYERGSLVKWVKNLPKQEWEVMLSDTSMGVLRMVHEIVQGMEYLHGMQVLHGDLKAANVLINDYGHCVISDFGQSELKSEAYRLSGTPLPHGTLRWQAPELMAGQNKLTHEVDIYAFAITCIELLTKGAVPWPLADDNAVRHFVLVQNIRPDIPLLREWSSHLAEIIRECWARDPTLRPSFSQLNNTMFSLRLKFGWTGREEVQAGEEQEEQDWIDWIDELDRTQKSPAMDPNISLPPLAPGVIELDVPPFSDGDTSNSHTPRFAYQVPGANIPLPPSMESSMSVPLPHTSSSIPPRTPVTGYSAPGEQRSGVPTVQIPTVPPSRASSLLPSSTDSEPWSLLHGVMTTEMEQRAKESKDERRYRISLQHEFHPSLTLALWSPSPVELGAVGYHSKPSGTFVTLFNAFRPLETSKGKTVGMPSLNGYGKVSVGDHRAEKRNAVKRKLDQFQDWWSRGRNECSDRTISRRYSTPLRNGHKTAQLFTESTVYKFVKDPELAAPRKWFQAWADHILHIYGIEHAIQKEDLILVIGTLETPDYAMFVSHTPRDGQVNFNVFAGSTPGSKWGAFSTTTDLSTSVSGGPIYKEEVEDSQPLLSLISSKVSDLKGSGEQWDTVLIARLRFAPDKDEPTAL